MRGDWYYPNGNVVRSPLPGYGHCAFMTNRGPNEIRNGSHFYGSVRLWRRYSPPERGRFCRKLPSAANPNVNQILYVNIGTCKYKVMVSYSTLMQCIFTSFSGFWASDNLSFRLQYCWGGVLIDVFSKPYCRTTVFRYTFITN